MIRCRRRQNVGWLCYSFGFLVMAALAILSVLHVNQTEQEILQAERELGKLREFASRIECQRQLVARTEILLAGVFQASQGPEDFPKFDCPWVVAV